MTINVTVWWWIIPIACIALGLLAARVYAWCQPNRDYDLVTPLICTFFVVLGIVAAAGVLVGKDLSG